MSEEAVAECRQRWWLLSPKSAGRVGDQRDQGHLVRTGTSHPIDLELME